MLDQPTAHQHKMRIRRKCLGILRTALDSVPQLGDAEAFLLSDAKARDAAVTLNALGIRVEDASTFVDHPRYSERIHVRLLAKHVSLNLLAIVDMSRGTSRSIHG